jgi:hypothetical protein
MPCEDWTDWRQVYLNLYRLRPAAHLDMFTYGGDRYVIGAIKIQENEILLVGREDRQSERRSAIVADRNARLHRFTAADKVEARRVQSNDVAQGRRDQGAMRVARQNRLAARSA